MAKLKDHFILKKEFILSLITISLPIALQNIISFGVNLMDSIMLGQLGNDTAVAAASLGAQPFFLLTTVSFSLASGACVMVAQYWGKKDAARIRQVMTISLKASFWIAFGFMLVSLLLPRQVMWLFNRDPELIAAGAAYQQIIAFSYIFFAMSNCYLLCLRAVELVKVSTFVYAVSFGINVFFNWCFIFGHCGAPALGVRGAAIGTVIARASELLMAVWYMYRREHRTMFRIRHLFARVEPELRADYTQSSLPVVFNDMLFGLGNLVMTLIVSNVSKTFAAAVSIAFAVNQVCSVAAYGVANASGILVGKAIGAGEKKEIRRTANTLILFAVLVGVAEGAIIFFGRHQILGIYHISEEASRLTEQLLIIFALLQPFLSAEVGYIVGVLRGGGDAQFLFRLNCGCMWLIGIPLGLVSGYVLHLPPAVIYFLMRSDTFFKCIGGTLRLLSGQWVRDVTRQ